MKKVNFLLTLVACVLLGVSLAAAGPIVIKDRRFDAANLQLCAGIRNLREGSRKGVQRCHRCSVFWVSRARQPKDFGGVHPHGRYPDVRGPQYRQPK